MIELILSYYRKKILSITKNSENIAKITILWYHKRTNTQSENVMIGLSFEKIPHYIYSNNRQFLPNELHMDRIFDEDVLLIMRKGILRFYEDGQPVELSPGEYYLQRAGLPQQGVVPSDKPNYFFIHFHGTFEEGGKLPLRGTFQYNTLHPIIEALELLGNAAPKLEYEKLFYALLSELAKQQHDETVAEAIRAYLVKHHTDRITLDELCEQFFLSKNQIIGVFKTAYGKTPHRYLTDYRLDKAAEYLVSTTRSLQIISNDVGFEDYSVFYRAFLCKYGVSPTDFRKIKSADPFIPPANEHPEKRKTGV